MAPWNDLRQVGRIVEAVVNAAARLGVVRIDSSGRLRVPFRVDPWWLWRARLWPAEGHREPFAGAYRNRPGVLRRVPGRLLPRRWGGWGGGIHVGDRGGGTRLVLLKNGRGVTADG